MSNNDWTRRDFVKASAAISAGALVPSAFAARTGRAVDDTIRVGVIGCGGRGTGAAANAIKAHPKVKIVAMADLFEDRLKGSHGWISTDEEYEKQGARIEWLTKGKAMRRFILPGYKNRTIVEDYEKEYEEKS